jgi:hypothetical protein
MSRGGIRLAALPALVLAAALDCGSASAQEPLLLDPAALDLVTAGGAKQVKAAGIVAQAVLPAPNKGLAELALKLNGRQLVVVIPPSGGTGSTGGGKKSVTASGKKTFKADRVTKGHIETLVVQGSVSG